MGLGSAYAIDGKNRTFSGGIDGHKKTLADEIAVTR